MNLTDLFRQRALAEGVATSIPMSDAVKMLKNYGADHFKTTTNELHFYKDGQPFSVDLVLNPDTTRSVTLSSLNSATRGLKGQGVDESDMSGLMHAARNYNKIFRVTAQTAEGDTKKYRVRAQSERMAREKFSQHHSMAKILKVEDVTDLNEGSDI